MSPIPSELRRIIDSYSTLDPAEAAARAEALLEAVNELSAELPQRDGTPTNAKIPSRASNRQYALSTV